MRIRALAALTAALLLCLLTLAGAFGQDHERYYVFSSDPSLRAQHAALKDFGHAFSAELTAAQAAGLRKAGHRLERVVLHQVSPSGKGRPGSGGRTAFPSMQYPWGILRVNGGSGGAGVHVAVLDTGANKDHLDLKGRVAQCKDFTGTTLKLSCKDSNGHGTHTAGTIAADGGSDGKGIFGVAPAARLYIYRVCGNSGFCWGDDIAWAIRHAADQGANIISMSLGSDAPDPLILDAVDYADAQGVLVVAAAGNDGPADGSIDYPGAYHKVVAVAASDSGDAIASWSSRGDNYATTPYLNEEGDVEFAAPGVSVESTWNNGGYAIISGTSMATPHVAGLAAKLWQGSAAATRDHLHTLALAGPDLGRPGDDPDAGFGLPRAP